MSVYQGYIWKLQKKYHSRWEKYSVVSVDWFDSSQNTECFNDTKYVYIMEPIFDVTDETRSLVKFNIDTLRDVDIIHYEDHEWKLKLP